MIRPIVKTFLWKFKLRIGCMVIAVVGMVVAGVCLFWNVLYLSFLAKENAFYFIFFLFMTAFQVVDFTFHLLLYFAAKKGDILIMKACLYYLCVKIFIDVILITVILVEYPNMLAMGIFFIVLFIIRIYFFIIVFSSYAVLLQRKSTHEVLGSLEPSEDLWRNPTGEVAPASSDVSAENENIRTVSLPPENRDKINLGVL